MKNKNNKEKEDEVMTKEMNKKLKKSLKRRLEKLEDFDGINQMIDEQEELPAAKVSKKKTKVVEVKEQEKPAKPAKKAVKFDQLNVKENIGDEVYQEQVNKMSVRKENRKEVEVMLK